MIKKTNWESKQAENQAVESLEQVRKALLRAANEIEFYCNKCASDFLPEQLAKGMGTQSSGAGGKKSAKHPCVSYGKLLKRDDLWGNYGSRMDYCDECYKRR